MIKKLPLNLVFGLLSFFTIGQNYSDYYTLINTAEEKFVINKDSSCYEFYDKAFEAFEPFLKDPFIACQTALYLRDTSRFYHYLKIGFENGLPITALEVSPIIRKLNTGNNALQISNFYTNYFVSKKIDRKVQDKFTMLCYQSDSIKMYMGTNDSMIALYHKSEDATRQFIRDSFLLRGLYPNERIIDISSDQLNQAFYERTGQPDVYLKLTGMSSQNEEFELRCKCPYNIILHSKCFFRENKKLFYQALLNGYVHPKEYGILEETSIIWHQNNDNPSETCGSPQITIGYNIFDFDRMKKISFLQIPRKG